jgi:FkbM family methyltransferase
MLFDQNLLADVASQARMHSRSSKWWIETDLQVRGELESIFQKDRVSITLGDIENLRIRNIEFGAIQSKHLFGLDELIIFSWYALNKVRYRKTLDLGANIGIHSLVMSKLGFDVTSYEPDPDHIEIFKSQLQDNSVVNVSVRPRAIANINGAMEFTRVVGNTTGSHLTGAKPNPYGELDYFKVDVDAFADVVDEKYDFIKMDVEGFEAKLFESLKPGQLGATEIMLEVGSTDNAVKVWNEIERLGLKAYSQKENWNKVFEISGIPSSYKEGSLFVSSNEGMSWK